MAVHGRSRDAWLLVSAGAIFILREGKTVFVPILVSVLLAYALEPFVAALMRLRIPRPLSVIVVYLIVLASAINVARVARSQANGFIEDLPAAVATLRHTSTIERSTDTRPGVLDHLQRASAELHAAIDTMAARAAAGITRVTPVGQHVDVRDYVLNAGFKASAFAGRLSIIAFLTFLLLVTGDFYKRKLVTLAKPRDNKMLTVEV